MLVLKILTNITFNLQDIIKIVIAFVLISININCLHIVQSSFKSLEADIRYFANFPCLLFVAPGTSYTISKEGLKSFLHT